MLCILSCTKNWGPFGVKLSGTAKICYVKVLFCIQKAFRCVCLIQGSALSISGRRCEISAKQAEGSAHVTQLCTALTRLRDGNGSVERPALHCTSQPSPPTFPGTAVCPASHLLLGPAWPYPAGAKKPSRATMPVLWLPLTLNSKLMLLEVFLEAHKYTLKSD